MIVPRFLQVKLRCVRNIQYLGAFSRTEQNSIGNWASLVNDTGHLESYYGVCNDKKRW